MYHLTNPEHKNCDTRHISTTGSFKKQETIRYHHARLSMRISGYGIFSLLYLLLACSGSPGTVSISNKGLYPEGLEHDSAQKSFLVTSLTKGVVGHVSYKGDYTPFIKDERLKSAIGLRVDREHNRLFVCSSDPGTSVRTSPETQRKVADLGVYDLRTGETIAFHHLGDLKKGNHFCNDIALAPDGTIYVTDSFNPVIYRITPNQEASVFIDSPEFSGDGFNLNGIVYHPDGYLLVAKYNDGNIYKIPVSDPLNFSKIEIPDSFPGADGLVLENNKSLIVIANASNNAIYRLSTEDNWNSASIISKEETGDVYPTTGVIVNGKLFVIHSMLNHLFSGKPEVKEFIIQQSLEK